ncbi:Virus X resistance protein-like, coiled-coil domain [Sesbania bispinosa]|nr:Virus X resistance protein-like, coiled-coil domain [Sesbania bispinosa]
MAETAVSFVLQQLYQLAIDEGALLKGAEKDFRDIKHELENIQSFLKDADRKAADEGNTNEGIKTWVKQLREASFHIEDVIDEYIMYVAQRVNHHPGCTASLQKIAHLIKSLKQRHQIASEIQDIKLSVREIKERSERYKFESSSVENGSSSSSSRGNKDVKWHDPRRDSFFIEETEVVGFESPRDELIDCLVGGTTERKLVSVVGMGGLGKTTLAKHVFENQKKFCKDSNETLPKGLREMDDNTLITEVRQYLQSKSYDDLPHRLKSCMLYFGIYPEDYTIKRKRLTRQWMAEGFVKYEERRTLEDVAEEYLTELIHRSLVQVSRIGFDGKVKSCQVHDLLREVIIRKMKDLSFCHLMHEDDEIVTVGITRRFSIAATSNNVLTSTSNSGIRAIFVFDKGELPEDFVGSLCAKFKLLKVLDFENASLSYVPDNLGNLFHLRYLNLSHTKVEVLPRSIGKLLNLETLDLRQTKVHVLPKEINKLTKLRLLPVYYRKYEGQYSMLNFTIGVQMQKGIGCLKSLQKLYFLEADHGGIDLIQELKMLKQLRKLGIKRVRGEYGNALCDAIEGMTHLESLNIGAFADDEIIDLDFISAPPHLRVLNLKARLTKLPDWIPKLKYLVKLRLGLSNLEDDPLDSLKNLPNLLRLNLWDNAFAGDSLHFQVGGFPKLKELDLTRLNRLSSVSIDKGALLGLEHFRFNNNPQLRVVPHDLKHLENLKFLGFNDMPAELVESIDPEKGGEYHWIIKHIPLVLIRQTVGRRFHDYELRPIPTLANGRT